MKLLTETQQKRNEIYRIVREVYREVDNTCEGSIRLKCAETRRRLEERNIKYSEVAISKIVSKSK